MRSEKCHSPLGRKRLVAAVIIFSLIGIFVRDDTGVAAAKERGGRLLKALTEEDSPAVTKGVKLLRGAHERVRERKRQRGDGEGCWGD